MAQGPGRAQPGEPPFLERRAPARHSGALARRIDRLNRGFRGVLVRDADAASHEFAMAVPASCQDGQFGGSAKPLSDNLAAPVVHDPLPLASAETDRDRRLVLLDRAANARTALAADYLLMPEACVRPAPISAPWAEAVAPEGARHAESAESRRDPEAPVSRYELMELLASHRFEDPAWFIALQEMSEGNLLRELVTLHSISLMLDWRRFRLDERRGAMEAARLALAAEEMRRLPGLGDPGAGNERSMRLLRFLFAPYLSRALGEAGRASRHLGGSVRALSGGMPSGGRRWRRLLERERRARTILGMALSALGLGLVGLGAVGLAADPAGDQAIDRDLFATADNASRDLLAFLSDVDVAPHAVLGDMLFVFNGGVLVLAGFLLLWHTVAGAVDTARTGRWGFGAWEIVRVVTAVALLAPLPGGMNGA